MPPKPPKPRLRRRITIGRTPDGAPIRKAVYARSKTELNAKVKEIKESLIRGDILDDRTTIGEYARIWLDASQSPSRHKTYQMYESSISNHIVPRVGHLTISKATPIQIQSALTAMTDEGLTRTVEIMRMALIQIYESAIDNGLANRNVAKRTNKPSYRPDPVDPLSETEISALLDADLSDKDRLFVLLCLFQGLRRGEALARRTGQIDEITVAEAWTVENNQGKIKPRPKTYAGNRAMPTCPLVRDLLERVSATSGGLYLFADKNGRPITETMYRGLWRRVGRALNASMGGVNPRRGRTALQVARPITAHTLRHTFCTMLYYSDFDLLQMQYLMGHDDSKTTIDVYTHLDKASLGKRDRYQKWRPMLRDVFLGEFPKNEKGSKRAQK